MKKLYTAHVNRETHTVDYTVMAESLEEATKKIHEISNDRTIKVHEAKQ